MAKTNLEPINNFRKVFAELPDSVQRQLHSLQVVHPGYYLKSTVYIKKKFCKSSIMMRKVKWQDSTMDFFDSIKGETVLSQRIIGALPHEVH